MGTSSSYSSPTTPEWRKAKSAVSRYASAGGETGGRSPRLPVARFVQALGGAREAARDASVGRAVAGGLLQFARTASARGADAALREAGLPDAIGLPADEALQRIVDTFATGANTLDETAARNALVEVMRELLADANDLDDAFENLDANGLLELLRKFIAAYIFWRFARALGDRLRAKSETGPAGRRREREIRRYIEAEVTVAFEDFDAQSLDWRRESDKIIERCTRAAFQTLGETDI